MNIKKFLSGLNHSNVFSQYAKLRIQGDTIIEVLLALAIIGFTLGLAFTTANRSTSNLRQSQERSEAVKITEQQAEQLSSLPPEQLAEITVASHPAVFCFRDSNNTVASFQSNPPENHWEDDLTNYPDECIDSALQRYHTHIVRQDSEGTFFVITRWQRLGSSTIDEVTIRLRKNIAQTPSSPTPPSPVAGCNNLQSIRIGDLAGGSNPQYLSSRLYRTQPNWPMVVPKDLPTPFQFDQTCTYEIKLTGIEYQHASDPILRPEQTQERFFAVGKNASNEITFVSAPTNDIPECVNAPRLPFIESQDPDEYERCTEIVNTYPLDRINYPIAQNTPTTIIEFAHISRWQEYTNQTSWSGWCPSGQPNNACDGAVEARTNTRGAPHSVHGGAVEIITL